MQQETITLTSCEVLTVERSTSPLNHHFITIKNDKSVLVTTVKKSWPGPPAIITEITGGVMFASEVDRHCEIAQHAARLARELNEQYRPGTEVSG